MTTSMIASMTPTDMLRRLVAFDTTSAKSNLALVAFVQEYLEVLGIPSRLSYDDAQQKANLLATLGPTSPASPASSGAPGLVLSGHSDCVPVDDQAWTSDPFVLQEREGRLYGRGTADMKGFLAIVLALLPELRGQ